MNDTIKFLTLFAFVGVFTTVNVITESQIQDLKTQIMVQGKLLELDDQRLTSLEKPISNTSSPTTPVSEFDNQNTAFLDHMNCTQINEFFKDVGGGLNGDQVHDDVIMRVGELSSACGWGVVLPNTNADKLNSIIPTCSSVYQTAPDYKWHYRTRNGTDLTVEQLLSRGNCY